MSDNIIIQEEKNLSKKTLTDLIRYIKNSIDIIVTTNVEDIITSYMKEINQIKNSSDNYEILLRKEEAEIRQHISLEHQLKIECEKLAEKVEILTSKNAKLIKKLVSNIDNILTK